MSWIIGGESVKQPIQTTPNNTDNTNRNGLSATKKQLIRPALGRFFLLLIIAVIPLSAKAGVLDSIGNFIDKAKAGEKRSTEAAEPSNATTIPLLQAPNSGNQLTPQNNTAVITKEDTIIASDNPAKKTDAGAAQQNRGEISVYVVKEGDSLSEIAELFNVTVNTIYWANDIEDPSLIKIGDSLVILPIAGIRHVVKAGDTVSGIAEKYQADMDEILSYNQLESADKIIIGDTLTIPGGNISNPTTKRYASTKKSSSQSANLIHPLPGSVRSQGIHGYNAVDLAAGPGTPIRAAARGQVVIAKAGGWNGGYGTYIVIKHSNGVQTLYAHNSRNIVTAGQSVSQGQTIGYVGNTGKSTGPHLHFEVRGARNPF